LVPNNSRDRTHIYDFSKDESVKTINWHQLFRVFSMFHTPYTIHHSTSRYQAEIIQKIISKIITKSSQKHHRDKSKSFQSTKILKY
jgi:hypothetical protein